MHPVKAVLTIGPVSVADAESWSVEEVLSFLHQISLGHFSPTFQENGVDGQMLCRADLGRAGRQLGLEAAASQEGDEPLMGIRMARSLL